jgi:hypothetical protein
MVRFLVVESIYRDSNSRFNISAAYLWLIIFLVVGNVHIDNKTLLMIDFINFKIKSTHMLTGIGCACVYS